MPAPTTAATLRGLAAMPVRADEVAKRRIPAIVMHSRKACNVL